MQIIFTLVEWISSFCEGFAVIMFGCLLTNRKKIGTHFHIIVLVPAFIGMMLSIMANFQVLSFTYTVILFLEGVITIRYITNRNICGISGVVKEYLRIIALTLAGMAIIGGFDYISMYFIANILEVSWKSLYASLGIGRTLVIITSRTLLLITIGILYYSSEQITILKRRNALLLIAISGLCLGGMYCFTTYSRRIFGKGDNGISLFTIILLYLVLLLTLRNQSDKEKKYKSEMELVMENQQNEILRRSVVDLERTFELWKTQIHDYKHVLLNLQHMADDKRYEEICEFIKTENERAGNNMVYYKTGNSTADVIIYSKGERAKNNNITYIVNSYLPHKIPLDDMELAVVLGNLLDNAIEAAKEMQKAFVEVTIGEENRVFHIEIRNSAKQLSVDESSKEDKIHHGIGLKSAEKIVKNKNGQFEIYKEEDEVIVEINIPY